MKKKMMHSDAAQDKKLIKKEIAKAQNKDDKKDAKAIKASMSKK